MSIQQPAVVSQPPAAVPPTRFQAFCGRVGGLAGRIAASPLTKTLGALAVGAAVNSVYGNVAGILAIATVHFAVKSFQVSRANSLILRNQVEVQQYATEVVAENDALKAKNGALVEAHASSQSDLADAHAQVLKESNENRRYAVEVEALKVDKIETVATYQRLLGEYEQRNESLTAALDRAIQQQAEPGAALPEQHRNLLSENEKLIEQNLALVRKLQDQIVGPQVRVIVEQPLAVASSLYPSLRQPTPSAPEPGAPSRYRSDSSSSRSSDFSLISSEEEEKKSGAQ